MKYNKGWIFRFMGNDSPGEVFDRWCEDESNTLLDNVGNYDEFVYTFPIIVDGEEVCEFTVVRCVDTRIEVEGEVDELMKKYFGYGVYCENGRSYANFDTGMVGFIRVVKEFGLSEIVKGFYGQESYFKDVDGNDVKYRISYGYPENDVDYLIYDEFLNDNEYDVYHIFDSDIVIYISKGLFNGYSLGEMINMNIKKRIGFLSLSQQ